MLAQTENELMRWLDARIDGGRLGLKRFPAMGIKIGQGVSMQVYLCKDIYTWISMHGYPRMDIRVFVCIILCNTLDSSAEHSVANRRVIIVW